MRARDVMTTSVITVEPDTSIEDIARTLLERRISAVPVTDRNGHVVGIVSEGDLMRRPESGTDRPTGWWLGLLLSPEEQAAEYIKGHGRRAEDVMSRPAITVEDSATLEEVADILERQLIKRVPVLREGKLVGIVSRANLLQGLVTAKSNKPITSDDETIRGSILESIREEAGVRDEFINVTVAGGKVHLWGAVHSEEEKKAVLLIAEKTIGVQSVEDHLGVFPPEVRSVLWE